MLLRDIQEDLGIIQVTSAGHTAELVYLDYPLEPGEMAKIRKGLARATDHKLIRTRGHRFYFTSPVMPCGNPAPGGCRCREVIADGYFSWSAIRHPVIAAKKPFSCGIPPEAAALVCRWVSTSSNDDGLVSGVLADHIQDYRHLWGIVNTRGQNLDALVEKLLGRLNSVEHNNSAI